MELDLSGSSTRSTHTSPRRLKRGGKNSSGTTAHSEETDKTDSKSKFLNSCGKWNYKLTFEIIFNCIGFSYPNYIVTSQPTSVCSDSETSTISQCSFVVQPASSSDNSRSATFVIPENDNEFYDEDELWKIDDEDETDGNVRHRPGYLELAGKSGSTPVSSRKPRFHFTGKFIELNKISRSACFN